MARLSMSARKALPRSAYVFPAKAPGHGSYPIPDRFAAGKPEESAVRSAVCRKFGIGCGK